MKFSNSSIRVNISLIKCYPYPLPSSVIPKSNLPLVPLKFIFSLKIILKRPEIDFAFFSTLKISPIQKSFQTNPQRIDITQPLLR